VAAAFVTWRGAEVVDAGTTDVVVGGMTDVVGGMMEVVVFGGAMNVDVVGTETLLKMVPPFEVTVTSEGTVTSTTVGMLVASVIGTKTVAFVVGGSAVFVIV